MEDYETARDSSLKHLRIADHMLTMTFPLVQDPKILMAVLENIHKAQIDAIASLLHYERMYKRIPSFHDTFESKMNMFSMKCMDRYSIPKEYLGMISEIRELIEERKHAPVEFRRKDKFVICSKEYDMKTISIKEIKDYLLKSKLFCEQLLKVIEKNERINPRR